MFLSHTPHIKTLSLSWISLDDEAIFSLANIVSNARNSLKHLHLGHNRAITNLGWQTFSDVLENASCALETLDV